MRIRFGKIIEHACRSHCFTLHRVADQVIHADDTPISPHVFGALPRLWGIQILRAHARHRHRRQWRWVFSVGLVALFAGCTNLLMPSGPSDRELQAVIDRNARNLLRLQADLFEENVSDIMGPPQRVEGYSWGTVWLYRTALTKGARATPETDFTPLVFDRRGVLLGWGKDVLASYSQRQPPLGGGPPR